MKTNLDRVQFTLRNKIEAMARHMKNWTESHPWIKTVYSILSWISLLLFILSLFFMKDSRTMFVQFLWSFYLLLQFWLLCRSKTFTWRKFTYFFMAGAWLIAPLNAVIVLLITGMFGGRALDVWSQSFITPVTEEVLKLLPFAIYLFLSRRATALSLSDYALAGAATGAGFQFLEETARRLVSGAFYGKSLLTGQVLHWEFFSLFPGYFEGNIFSDGTSAGHAVLTAMVTVGFGLALRYKHRLKRATLLIPLGLLVLSILDHIVWNAGYRAPDVLKGFHDLLGSGYASKPLFLGMLIAAVSIDYWDLNRVKDKLLLLPEERLINPVSEVHHLLSSLYRDRQRFGSLLYFYRERRELGFTLIRGDEEARSRVQDLSATVHRYYGALLLLTAILIITGYGWFNESSGLESCFACLFDSLQNWWDHRLSGAEKVMLIAGAFALFFPFLGAWSALGAVSAAAGLAQSGHQVADIIRHPRKLASPEYAAAAVFTLGFNRLPFGKIVGKRILKTAAGWKKYELVTKDGLVYRTTLGKNGELRAVFAKIEPNSLGKGTDTNDASRKLMRLFGGRNTDDAGHAIGNKLGGLGNKNSANLFPQNHSINRGAFRAFEKQIHDEVKAGKTVFVRVVPKYAAGANRPHEVAYSVRVNGRTITRIFKNP
ncbi:DNA/RNA non-specific endonuclease [Fictibacillus fluitans]|uniref:PrsW family glutamic-type intramembrane protease n=1 Tax=Fictibacillus fluitans TaxID=3058422 RepID=A0ABT8HTA1_9BACL|nr:PrsW family glutamic-type intramembrane protease [Fictibacillus sp. NE201]MDN4523991.1 PrsW family glutamic-type intramembrane protease [Fictibacillus sp. NE201]